MAWLERRPDSGALRAARRVLAALGVAAGYYIGGVLGTVLSVPPSGFAILWPATAFLIGVMLIAPPRTGWLYLAGVVPAHAYLAARLGDVPWPVAALQVAGNVGLALATVAALRRAGDAEPRFDSFRAVLRFILLAGVVVPAVGNALILGVHLMTGWTEAFWLSWRQWMLASIFPTLTIPPLLVVALGRGQPGDREMSRRQAVELAGVCLILFAINFEAFGTELSSSWWPMLALLCLPPLVWVAVRMGVASTSLALLVFAAATIVRALDGRGPFAVGASSVSVLSLQVFLTALSAPLLLLSALSRERRQAEEQLKGSEARLQMVAASTDTGLWQWRTATRQLWMTQSCRSMFGIAPDAPVTTESFLEIVHPDDRANVSSAFRSMLTSGDVETTNEFRARDANGEFGWFVLRTHTDFDAAGRPLSVSGVFRNVTQRVGAQKEVAELAQRLQTLQEEERQKIAEELHEATAQNLVAVGLNLTGLKRRMALNDSIGSLVDDAFTSLAQARNELRAFTYMLRPEGLDREGLCAVLLGHVRRFSRWSGIAATLHADPDADRMSLEHQRAILRIVQESLINAQRHAGATRVSVRLRRVRDELHVVVRDNGRGLHAASPRPGETPGRPGVGIPGMTARVLQLGGRIVIRSNARGATVHVVLPIAQAAAADDPAKVLAG